MNLRSAVDLLSCPCFFEIQKVPDNVQLYSFLLHGDTESRFREFCQMFLDG